MAGFSRLTQYEDASLVDGDPVSAAAVLHGGHWLPHISGYTVPLHGAELGMTVIPSYCIQVRVHTHQTYTHTHTEGETLSTHFGRCIHSLSPLRTVVMGASWCQVL